MEPTIGTRVGAIMESNATEARIFGYGVYSGREVPPAVSPMTALLHEIGKENPKITLDNGKVVWGCECWWGSEEEIKKAVEGHTVTEVDIDELRKEALEAYENGSSSCGGSCEGCHCHDEEEGGENNAE